MENRIFYQTGAHHIDPQNPNWVENLLSFHRNTFGTAVMEAKNDDGGNEGGDDAGANQNGNQNSNQNDNPKGTDGDADKTDWEALAKQYAAQAKANEKAAAELKKIEDAKKSELELAQEQIATLTAERDAAKLASLRLEVGKDLPAEIAELLKGETKTELEAHAKKLAQLFKPGNGKNGLQVAGGGAGNRESQTGKPSGEDLFNKRYKKNTK